MQYLNATKPLLQQSMISKDKAQHILSMHRLVGAVTQNNLALANRQTRFDEAVELIYRVYPQLTVDKIWLNDQASRCRLYVPQIVSLERYYRESESPLIPRSEFATILASATWFLFESGLPGQAMELLPTARAVGERTINGNEFSVAMVYRTLGGIYLDINKGQAALDSWARQLEIEETTWGPESLEIAHGLTNIGFGQIWLGDLEEAESNLKRAEQIRLKYPDKAKGSAAQNLDVQSILERFRKNYDNSIRLMKKAIALYDGDLGVGNTCTAL